MELLNILLILLIIAAIFLCVYLIIWLKKISQSFELIQKDIHEICDKSLPVLEKLNEASDRLNSLTKETQDKIGKISKLVEDTKEKFSWFATSGTTQSSSQPAENLVHRLKALSKGISAFFAKMR